MVVVEVLLLSHACPRSTYRGETETIRTPGSRESSSLLLTLFLSHDEQATLNPDFPIAKAVLKLIIIFVKYFEIYFL